MAEIDISRDNYNNIDTGRLEKSIILKNVLIMGFGLLMNFTAYNGLGKLQSTLHHEEGMGVINQGILYIFLVLSCLLAPNLVISLLGQKWTLCLSVIGYIIWMLANAYPVWGTMVPASITIGICAAPLGTAQSSYAAKLGTKYATINNEDDNVVIGRFLGISFGFLQSSSILGSIVAFGILRQGIRNGSDVSILQHCGINDCPWHNHTNTNLKKPENYLIWTLVGVYVATACAGLALMVVFLDKLPPELRDKINMKKLGSDSAKRIKSTLGQLKKKKQLLLLPLTIYAGLEQSYYSADFTNSFVGCALGTHMVGLILLPAFAVGGITCVASGLLVKYTGRVPLFLTGFSMDFAQHMVMRVWQPDPSKLYVFFLMMACLGVSQGIWRSQITGLYGVLFKDETESGFASYFLWDSIGCALGYGWSHFLCTWHKLAILTSMLCVGVAGYLAVELLDRRDAASNRPMDKTTEVHGVIDVENNDGVVQSKVSVL